MVGWGGCFKGRHSTLTQAPLAAEHRCCAKNVLGFLGGGHIGSLSDRSIVCVSDGLCDWAVVSSHVWAPIVCAGEQTVQSLSPRVWE